MLTTACHPPNVDASHELVTIANLANAVAMEKSHVHIAQNIVLCAPTTRLTLVVNRTV
jgi:hypothetical protein